MKKNKQTFLTYIDKIINCLDEIKAPKIACYWVACMGFRSTMEKNYDVQDHKTQALGVLMYIDKYWSDSSHIEKASILNEAMICLLRAELAEHADFTNGELDKLES